jgi:hypothetical protein
VNGSDDARREKGEYYYYPKGTGAVSDLSELSGENQ